MSNILFMQRTASGAVSALSNVLFNSTILNTGDIVYDSLTGNITFNTIGQYNINWFVTTQTTQSSAVAFVVNTPAGSYIGNSPLKTGEVYGEIFVDVNTVPYVIQLKNFSTNVVYYSSAAQIKANICISAVQETGSSDTMYDFQIAQLAHILSQIITLYPANVIRIYVRGLYAIDGTPTELYSSASGPGLFITTIDTDIQAMPLNMITGVYLGDASTYNESITYLPAPTILPSGWDTNVITSVQDYLPVGTACSIYFSIGNSKAGEVYKDELGMVVVTTDDTGLEPTFIPATEASIIITSSAAKSSIGKSDSSKLVSFLDKKEK